MFSNIISKVFRGNKAGYMKFSIHIHSLSSLTIDHCEPLYILCHRHNKQYRTVVSIPDPTNFTALWESNLPLTFVSSLYHQNHHQSFQSKVFHFTVKKEKPKKKPPSELMGSLDLASFSTGEHHIILDLISPHYPKAVLKMSIVAVWLGDDIHNHSDSISEISTLSSLHPSDYLEKPETVDSDQPQPTETLSPVDEGNQSTTSLFLDLVNESQKTIYSVNNSITPLAPTPHTNLSSTSTPAFTRHISLDRMNSITKSTPFNSHRFSDQIFSNISNYDISTPFSRPHIVATDLTSSHSPPLSPLSPLSSLSPLSPPPSIIFNESSQISPRYTPPDNFFNLLTQHCITCPIDQQHTWNTVPVSAVVIFRCLYFYRNYLFTSTHLTSLFSSLHHFLLQHLQDIDTLSFWLSNLSFLYHLCNKYFESSSSEPSSFQIFMTQVANLSQQIFQSIFNIILAQIHRIQLNHFLDNDDDISSTDYFDPLFSILSSFYIIFQTHHVFPSLRYQIISQILQYVSSQLFNLILSSSLLCNVNTGMRLALFCSSVESWSRDIDGYHFKHHLSKSLSLLRQTSQLFMSDLPSMNSSHIDFIFDLCPSLNIIQLEHLLSNYQTEQGFPLNISFLQQISAKSSSITKIQSLLINPFSSLHLDLSLNVGQINLSCVTLPPIVNHDPSFHFLLEDDELSS